MKEEKWIPAFSKDEIEAIRRRLGEKEEIHPDSSYGQWMKIFNKEER